MNKKGMTLVELLAVIGILATLALLAIPNGISAYKEAKKKNFVTEAQTIFRTAVSQVEVDHSRRTGYVIYCRVNGEKCQGSDKFETLELTGSTSMDYFIVVDKNSDI